MLKNMLRKGGIVSMIKTTNMTKTNNSDSLKMHFYFNNSFKYFSKSDKPKYKSKQNFNNKKNTFRKNKPTEEFTYKLDDFNMSSSKYSLNKEEQKYGVEVPQYLRDPEKFNKKMENGIEIDMATMQEKREESEQSPRRGGLINPKKLKSGKKVAIIKPEFQRKLTKQARLERHKQLLLEESKQEKNMKSNKFIAKEERKLIENNEKALDRFDDKYKALEKQKIRNEIVQIRKERATERRRIFNPENLIYFNNEERLSKRIARLGVTSRRQAEKMIKQGMIKVDGKSVDNNVVIDGESEIQVYSNSGYKTPISESTKIWLFYKPAGITCNKDEKSCPTIYKYLEAQKFMIKHYIVVGKLDINSEGLVILTNNGDIAAALDNNEQIERQYKVRVYGRMFTEEKLEKIRRGIRINMRTIKLWPEMIRKQSANTWVHIKAFNNSIVDIRNVFRKLSLRVNRIIRTNYGPYSLGVLKQPGQLVETNIHRAVHKYLYHRYKEKTQVMKRKLDETKIESVKLQLLKEQKAAGKVNKRIESSSLM